VVLQKVKLNGLGVGLNVLLDQFWCQVGVLYEEICPHQADLVLVGNKKWTANDYAQFVGADRLPNGRNAILQAVKS
jgi:hypothetical protein